MFNIFKRKRELPELSGLMLDSIRTTTATCRRQIEMAFGPGVTQLPKLSPEHDNLVGTYAWGFLQGTFLVNHADITWAKGDQGLAQLGFGIAIGVVLAGIIPPPPERILTCRDTLIQLHSDPKPADDVLRVDRAGGHDGIAIAAGRPLPKGGQLLALLNHVVTAEEKANALR